jgi:hypothetical protein
VSGSCRQSVEAHFLPGNVPQLNSDGRVWARSKGMFRQAGLGPDERGDIAVELAMKEIGEDAALLRRPLHDPNAMRVQDAFGRRSLDPARVSRV